MDTVFLALRVLVSLGAVLGVIWFAYRWLSGGKAGTKARVRGKQLRVVAKQGLGAKASVVLLETDGRRFLLGVTEHAITVLERLELPEEAAVPTTPIRLPSFDRALQDARTSMPAVVVHEPAALPPSTRRAVRQAEAATGKTAVAGSILSPDTWRQTAMALRRVR